MRQQSRESLGSNLGFDNVKIPRRPMQLFSSTGPAASHTSEQLIKQLEH